MAQAFKDHFSTQAPAYSGFRPRYPGLLYGLLAAAAPGRDCAWDCATGSGQAAAGLADYFTRVVATDASPRQLAHAEARPGVSYAVAVAERVPLADASVDLVTVAQALHWFHLEGFYGEVARVLRPGGVLAAWSYGLHRIDPAIDAVVHRLYDEVVGAYWPPERRHVEEGYARLPFPFLRVPVPELCMAARWRLEDLAGYLGTWSAVQRYKDATGEDPVAALAPDLARAWGRPATRRTVTWDLTIRLGRREA